MADKTSLVALGYKVDQSSVDTAVLANTRVLESIQAVGQGTLSVAEQLTAMGVSLDDVTTASGQRITSAVTDPLEAASAAAKNLIHDIGDLGRDIQSIPEPDLSAFGVAGGDTGGGGNSLGGLRAGAGLLGAAAGGQDLRAASQIITLGSAFGVTGVAAGALILTLRALEQEMEGVKQATAAALAAQKVYYDAIATATTKQARDQLATLNKSNEQIQIQIQEIQSAQEKAANAFSAGGGAQGQSVAGQFIGSLADALAGGQLSSTLSDLQKQFASNTDAATRLQQGLDKGAFSANDAADTEKKLADARAKTNQENIALIQQDAQTRLQLVGLRNTGADQLLALQEAGGHNAHNLTDQVYAQIKANQDRAAMIQNVELPALARLGDSSEETSHAIHALIVEQTQLTKTNDLLTESVLPVVAARQNEINLLQAQKDASDALNPILQDINKTQVDLGNGAKKTSDAWIALNLVQTDHAAKELDIQAQYNAATTTALTKKNEQLAKIDANAAERHLQQRENDNLSIEDAVARGDTAQAQHILRQQQVKDTQDARQVEQQKSEAEKIYSDQLDAAKVQETKLLASEQERYLKELSQRRTAYDQAVQDQKALSDRLTQLRNQEAFQAQYNANIQAAALAKLGSAAGAFADQVNHYAAQINARNANGLVWKDVGSGGGTSKLPAAYGAGLIGPQSLAAASGYGSTPGSYSPLPPITGTAAMLLGNSVFGFRAGGGDVIAGKGYVVGERGPEWFSPASNGRIVPNGGGMGGDTVIINIDAKNSTIPLSQWKQWGETIKIETVQAITERNNKVRR